MIYEAEAGNLTITAGGDAMITRKLSVFREKRFTELVELFRDSDVGYANLEMLMHDFEHSPGSAGGTFTGSNPSNLEELKWAGINLVSTANNHSQDYGEGGVLTNLKHLRDSSLEFAGTGKNLSEARGAAYLDTKNGRVGLISTSSTFAESGRALDQRPDIKGRPGLNPQRFNTKYIVDRHAFDQIRRTNRELGLQKKRDALRKFRPEGVVSEDTETSMSFLGKHFELGDDFSEITTPHVDDMEANLRWISDAKRMSDWVIVSFHCHEAGKSVSDPPNFLIEFAHRCIESGADVFLGHGPHLTRGLELYKGKPIFYSLGNFIFQNDTVLWQPSFNYELLNLGPMATPADFYDKRSVDGRGFPGDPIYWESIITRITFKSKNVSTIELIPIDMGYGKPRSMTGRPVVAEGRVADRALRRMRDLSGHMGTKVRINNGRGYVQV